MQGSEQKVSLLIGELDRLRAGPGLDARQIVDLVQSINDARSPEPKGSNSSYSLLLVRHFPGSVTPNGSPALWHQICTKHVNPSSLADTHDSGCKHPLGNGRPCITLHKLVFLKVFLQVPNAVHEKKAVFLPEVKS